MSHPMDGPTEKQGAAAPPPPGGMEEEAAEIEAEDMVEEEADDRTPPPPPPPSSHARPEPPSEVEPSIEEVDPDLLEGTTVSPRHNAIDDAVREAGQALGDAGHAVLIGIYERELATLTAPDADRARVALYQHEIGELYEASGDEGAAVKAYAKALQSDATLKPNLWAIRRVFQRRALWPNLLKLLDAEIRFARSDAERAELLVEKGQLLEDRLNDFVGARECYTKATETHPACLAAWMSLEKLVVKDGDLAALQTALRGQVAATTEPGRKVALLLDLSRLQKDAGGSLDDAMALAREAAAVGADRDRALDELERLAETAGRNEELLAALDLRAEHLERRSSEVGIADRLALTERLVALRRRQAHLARTVGEGARAWGYLEAAQKLAPDEPLLLRDRIELAESLSKWDEMAALVERRMEDASEPARVGLMLERAQALRRATRANDADAVENEVLAKLPGHLGLLVARERGALDGGDWEKLVAIYQSEAQLALGGSVGGADKLWAATALTQAATLLSVRLGRDGDALRVLEEAIAHAPGSTLVYDALERTLMRAGRHQELASLYEAQLEGAPPPRKKRLLEALASLREVQLDDPAGAAQAVRRLIALHPEDVRPRIRLVELDRAAGKWTEAAEDLAALSERLPGERKADALLVRAEILERRVGDEAAAQAGYREVLSLRPSDAGAADGYETISRRRNTQAAPEERDRQAWDDLAAALKREAEASVSPERTTQALLRLGEIHERERNNFADAAQAYRDLLDKNPGHAAALRGLQRAHAALGDQGKRAAALADEIEVLAPSSRPGKLVQLGEIYEDKLKKDDEADDAFARALDDAQAAPHAALGRLRVAARRREVAQMSAALERLSTVMGDSRAARAALLDERAVLERWAGDAGRARALLAEAAMGAPEAPEPMLGEARLHAHEGNVAELATVMERLGARSGDGNLQATAFRRAAFLRLGVGVPPDKLLTSLLEKARAASPNDVAAAVALTELGGDEEALAARIALAEGAAQTAWRVERGEALEALGRLSEAAAEAARALNADPKNLPALILMRRLAKAGGDEAGLAHATAQLAGALLEGERAAALYSEAGELFDRLGMRKQAAACFRAVLDKTPNDGAAFRRARQLLGALHLDEHDPGPLVELIGYKLAHARGEDRVALLMDRAEILTGAEDKDGAERDLRGVLEIDREHLEAIRRLGILLGQKVATRGDAIALFQRYLDLERDKVKRRAAHLHLADLEEQLGRLEEAVRHLEAALETAARPSEEERLATLLVRLRQWPKAVLALKRLAALTPDGHARAQVEIRIASIYRDGFSDPKSSVEALMRSLRSEPLELEALGRLVNMSETGHVIALELEERLDLAIEKARSLAVHKPLEPGPYQALARLCAWRGDEDGRIFAMQAHALYAGQPVPPREGAIEPARELSPASWERILPPGALTIGLDIWRVAWEGSFKLFGPELASLQVGKGDRLNHKGIGAAWIAVDKIARALGCAGYELYGSRDPAACTVTGGALVCGIGYADRLTPAARFRVARKLALLRDRLGPVERIDEAELALFFAACARVAEVPRPAVLQLGAAEARVEERAKTLGKALGRKERNALKSLGPRWNELVDPTIWKRAILEGAARAALAVAGDLQVAQNELGWEAKSGGGAMLATFSISADMAVLRRELGLRA